MLVVYDSFEGRYSDNPRAIYEALLARGDGHEHIWITDPRHVAGFPPGVHTVTVNSPEAVAALERADLVICNTHIDAQWTKKPGARYLQTWHGTPLKRVHRDILQPAVHRLLELDVDIARWDYLLSPNAASTPMLRQAFTFEGEVFEAGYPRNDVLLSPERDVIRAKVRADLDIADDVTAVLYTPTYRDGMEDGHWRADFALGLDAEAVLAALGPGHVLMLRPHYFVTDRLGEVNIPGARDVAYYPDIAELYLAADVMVTDYSSTMFDFAVTAKPLVYFTPDLESYRDETRGFYFDLAVDPPGPITRTQDQLVAALSDLPGTSARFREAYQRFRTTFSSLEDGHATERVLARYVDGRD